VVKPTTAERKLMAPVVATLVAVFVFAPWANAQQVDDHTPWWLWPEVWTGEFEYDETVNVSGLANEDTRVTGLLLLDKKKTVGCTATWVGVQPNIATIESQGSGQMNEQTEVARLHGRSWSSASGRFPLAAGSGLAISLEQGAYKVLLFAADGAAVEGSSGATGAVDSAGISQSTGWKDRGEAVVEFEKKAYSPIPETIGVLENGALEEKGTNDAGFTSKFRWVFQPEHDVEAWVSRYVGMLESERASFIEMHREFLEKMDCDGGLFESTPCRACRAALEDVDRRITRLADDCRRVLEKLVNIECPGFSKGMKATPRDWQYENAVCTDPAKTCDVIHRHVFDYFDTEATGDLLSTYRRLPSHLQCMYDLDEFEKIATLSSTDWVGKLLGQ
jgi:hypothetical protein